MGQSRFLSRLFLAAALAFATMPALAAPIPITGSGPVAGENIPTTATDGSTVQRPAQIVVVSDEDGNLGSLGDNATPVTPAAATATNGSLLGCEYRSTLPTFTNTQQGAVQCDSKGRLTVAGENTSNGDDLNPQLNGIAGRDGVARPLQSGLLVFDGTNYDRWPGNSAGGAYVQGSVASGATATGFPIPIAANYRSTPPTYTDGQRAELNTGTRGALRVELWAPDSTNAITTGNVTGDDISGAVPIATASRNFVYDPTDANWDRARMWQNAANIASTDSGLPAVGLMAQCDDTSITATTENQAGNLRRDCADGGLIVRPYAGQANSWAYAAAASGIVNTTTAVTIKAAAGASVKNCLVSLQIAHDTLGAVTEIAIRDGASGTVVWRGRLQTTATEGAGGHNFRTPICGTANTLMEVVTLTAVTGAVYVSAQGFTGP